MIYFSWSKEKCTLEWETVHYRALSLIQQCYAELCVNTNGALVVEGTLKKKSNTLLLLKHIEMIEIRQLKSTGCLWIRTKPPRMINQSVVSSPIFFTEIKPTDKYAFPKCGGHTYNNRHKDI